MVRGYGRDEVRLLIIDLRRMGGSISRQLGVEMKAAAESTAATARRNASWSSRIPANIRTRVSRSHRFPGALIAVNTKKAPHARVYEWGDGRRSNTFRHPVFGRRDQPWVTQQTRPYITPAARAHRHEYEAAIDAAVSRALKAHGFRGLT